MESTGCVASNIWRSQCVQQWTGANASSLAWGKPTGTRGELLIYDQNIISKLNQLVAWFFYLLVFRLRQENNVQKLPSPL